MSKNTGYIASLPQLSADPATPDSGYSIFYPKTDNDWYTKSPGGTVKKVGDMLLGAANTMGSGGSIILPTLGNNSNLRVGSLEFQSTTTNQSLILDNMYYNGSDWKFRNNGYGSLLHMNAGAFNFYNSGTGGSAGGSVSITNIFGISAAGFVGGAAYAGSGAGMIAVDAAGNFYRDTYPSGGGGGGSVTSFAFTNSGGFTGSVSNSTSTPTLSLVLQDAAADGSTKGQAGFTAADFNATSGIISIDYTNGQAASGSTKGFLTSTDWTTFNNKQAALVNGTNIKSINGESILGAGDLVIDEGTIDLLKGVFVDSNIGLDTNDGLSIESPVRTIAQLLAIGIPDGEIINVGRGSYFREFLDLRSINALIIKDFGTGPKPVFDAADVVGNNQFTKTSGRTNVYEVSFTNDFGDNSDPSKYSAWENGLRLIRATSLSNCDSTPGSFYAGAATIEGGTDTIYFHAATSTSLITNNQTYEITRRSKGIQVGNDCRVFNMHCKRNGSNDGSFKSGVRSYIFGVIAEDGVRHNFFMASGTADNCAAWKCDNVGQTDGCTLFISYTDDVAADEMDVLYKNCVAVGTFNNVWAIQDGIIGLYAHTGVSPYRSLVVDGGSYACLSTAISSEANELNVRNAFFKKAAVGISKNYGNIVVSNNIFTEVDAPVVTDGSYLTIFENKGTLLSDQNFVRGNIITMNAYNNTVIAANSDVVNIYFASVGSVNMTITLRRNIVLPNSGGGVGLINFTGAALSEVDLDADYNSTKNSVYLFSDGIRTFATMQGLGYDLNSTNDEEMSIVTGSKITGDFFISKSNALFGKAGSFSTFDTTFRYPFNLFNHTTGMAVLSAKSNLVENFSKSLAVNTQDLFVYKETNLYSLSGTGSRMVVADAAGKLSTQAIPTAGGGESLQATFDIGNTITDESMIWASASGTGRGFELSNLSVADNFGILKMKGTGTNQTSVLRLMPKGTGASSTSKTRIDLFNTDFDADTANYEYMTLGANGSAGYVFNSISGGTGTAKGWAWNVNGSNMAYLTDIGSFYLNDLDDGSAVTQMVTVNNGILGFTTIPGGGGGMTNPMTTAGDIITGGSSGTPQRLAAGTNGYVLKMVSGAPAWAVDATGAGSSQWNDNANGIDYTAGFVGIGIALPLYPLHIDVNQNAITQMLVSNTNSGSSSRASIQLVSDDANAAFTIKASTTAPYGILAASTPYIYTGTGNGFVIMAENGPLKFAAGSNTSSLTLGADGSIFFNSLNDATSTAKMVVSTDGILSLQTIPGGGSGEANTASNLGGGLANYSGKSGVDLQFNSFSSTDFDLASNLITVDASIARLAGPVFTTSITTPRIISSAGTPSVTDGPNLNATVTVDGTDTAGRITVVVNSVTSLPTLEEYATVTFNVAYASTPRIVFSPGNAAAAGLEMYLKNPTTNNFSIARVNSGNSAATTYIWDYMVVQ